jgi:site-specific recombinase XerD
MDTPRRKLRPGMGPSQPGRASKKWRGAGRFFRRWPKIRDCNGACVVTAAPDAPQDVTQPPWLDDMTAVERAYRARVLGERGALRRSMATIERSTLPAAQVLEVWRWVMSIRTGFGLAPHTTTARYAEIVSRFLGWCVEQGLDYRQLRPKDVDEWQKSLYVTRRNGIAWRRVQLQALRSLYGWRHQMGLGANCTAGIRPPRKGIRTPRKYSREQLRKLFAAVGARARNALLVKRDTTMMLFLLATGARRDEVGDLRLDQLDLTAKTGVVRFLGKGSRERVVGFEGPIVDALREWIIERDQHGVLSDAVFWSTDIGHGNYGHRLSGSGIERTVRRYAIAAGLGSWGVHRFRVTYATQLYDSDVDIERIRIALGHESIETTRRYLAVSERQSDTRLPAHLQWDALGLPAKGLPLWAQRKEGMGE